MRTFRSSDSASEIGSSETSFSEHSQPYFALCSPRSKSSANVSNNGGNALASPCTRTGTNKLLQQQQSVSAAAVAYHHQPCRRSSSVKVVANKPRPVVRRDLGHVNSFPDSHHHKTPPGVGSSSASYYTPPRSPSLSVTTPTDTHISRRSPTTPSSTVFKFPPSVSASSSFGGSAMSGHYYGRNASGTNPNTPRTLPRSPSTGSANTTSYNTNSDSACNTHRWVKQLFTSTDRQYIVLYDELKQKKS